MGKSTNIAWTDATVNFWWGCTKAGPGCEHCYAESLDRRWGGTHWGPGVPRRKIKGAVKELHKLDNEYADWAADVDCARHNAPIFGLPVPLEGYRRRVFIQSMSDLFDTEVSIDWFAEAWKTICACDRVDIQIVTKRVSVVEKRLAAINAKWPKHAGLIATVVTQDESDRDVPRLRALKANLGIPWIGLSVEPMLEPIHVEGIDWVICGGESGPKRRPFSLQWAEDLGTRCVQKNIPFFFKQDSALKPGQRGGASDDLWNTKQFPRAA